MQQLRLLPILISFLVATYASAAWGTVVAVNPVRVLLSEGKHSEQLKLTNNGDKAASFQVTAHTWHETPDGHMQLVQTNDLLFFPSLLEIGPKQSRRVRIGSTVPAGNSELSYRIIVTELPSEGKVPGVVQVLTRLSVPVFVQPAIPHPKPALTARVEHGQLLISLQNLGNSYFKATFLRVIARSKLGPVLLDKTLAGWYVLASTRREYSLTIPKDVCSQLISVTTTVTTERGKTSVVSQVPAGSGC
ncbi:MAG: fimbria/pilus periplasmic chaperone [Pseudomonadota bacterium]